MTEWQKGNGKTWHRIVGFVEKEHYMNGRECPKGGFDVIEYRNSGDFDFDCRDCKVSIGSSVENPDGDETIWDELAELWDGEVNKNLNSRAYPSRNMPAYVVRQSFRPECRRYGMEGDVYHVPVEQLDAPTRYRDD